MNEFKLTAWPDLPAAFRQIGYRRMLSDLSQRHITEAELVRGSGLSRHEVRALLHFLKEKHLLDARPCHRIETRWPRPTLARLRQWWRVVRA